MIKLYGFTASNYFNIVKHTLLAREIEYEYIETFPGQDKNYQQKSPMAKVPCIETDQGFLSESIAIILYLEDAYTNKPLLPTDPFTKAKVLEAIKIAELYLEITARRLLPTVLVGAPASEEKLKAILPQLKQGIKALVQVANFSPYLCTEQLSLADIYVYHALKVVKLVSKNIYQWNIFSEAEQLKTWDKMMAGDEVSQKVDAESAEGMKVFNEYLASLKKK